MRNHILPLTLLFIIVVWSRFGTERMLETVVDICKLTAGILIAMMLLQPPDAEASEPLVVIHTSKIHKQVVARLHYPIDCVKSAYAIRQRVVGKVVLFCGSRRV